MHGIFFSLLSGCRELVPLSAMEDRVRLWASLGESEQGGEEGDPMDIDPPPQEDADLVISWDDAGAYTLLVFYQSSHYVLLTSE